MSHPTFDQLPLDQQTIVRRSITILSDEFTGTFGQETIERFVFDSLDLLAPSASVHNFLPLLSERFARERLHALARVEGFESSERPSVLFLCVHNAGRSQMAAGWLRHLAGDRVDVFSGGSEPTSRLNPAVVESMSQAGIDISQEFPKPWTDEIVRAADVVITMGCGDACPLFPGKRYEDWDLTDPTALSVDDVALVRDDIRTRVEHLMASLGVSAAHI